jgi:lactate permease
LARQVRPEIARRLTLLYLFPVLTIIALLASRKASLLGAGVAGLLLTLPGAYLALASPSEFAGYLLGELAAGAWLAWQAISVILGGLLFHNVVNSTHPELFESRPDAAGAFSYRRLLAICFLLGPFFEAASGFGLGIVIALPFLLRLGMTGPTALLFALFSQILVPWGALAIGSEVGAELAGVTLQDIGIHSALLSIPLLFGYLFLFWRFAALEGHVVGFGQRIDDLLWVGALAALLYVANRYIAVETAGVLACGALLALRFGRDVRPSLATWQAVLPPALPYIALTAVLLMTRTIPPWKDFLQHAAVIRPFSSMAPFPPFYHASFWLLTIAVLYGVTRGIPPLEGARIARRVWDSGKVSLAVTLVFVVMAEIMVSSGMAHQLAQAWVGRAGSHAVLATPLFAAVAGFLTGSNVGSNAIMMPLQGALAAHSAHEVHWVAALQNTAGSSFTMLSATRVAMGAALLKITGQEHIVYRRAWPIGAAILTILLIAVSILSLR